MNTKSNLLKSIFISLILLVGTTSAWGAYNQSAVDLYFDNSEAKWSSCYVYIGHSTWTSCYPLTRVSGTQYLWKLAKADFNGGSTWNGATGWVMCYEKWWDSNGESIDKYTWHGAKNVTKKRTSAWSASYIYKTNGTTSVTSDGNTINAYNTTTVSNKNYTVTINTATGGTLTVKDYDNNTVSNGASKIYLTVLKFSASASTGYTFDRVEINNGSTTTTISAADIASKTYTLTSNVTITPIWTPNTYNITYKDQGNVAFSGTHASGYPTTHTYGTATTLKSPTKNNYTFDGWFTSSNCSGSAISSLSATGYTDNITLYAKWTINTHTVSYGVCSSTRWGSIQLNSETATTTTGTKTLNYGTAISFTATPNTGYQVVGWYSNADCTTQLQAGGNSYNAGTLTANKTVYVKFEQIPATAHNITYTTQGTGWTYDANNPTSADEGERVTFTVTPATGYTVNVTADVNLEQSGNDYTFEMPGKDVAIKVSASPKTYTVSLDNQDATTAGATSVTATYGSAMPSIANNLPTKTGYTFGGYYTATDGGGTQYYKADGTSAKNWAETSVTELYAKWTPNTYTITYKDKGDATFSGTHESDYPTTHTYGAETALKTATKSGYTFDGWFTASDCSGSAVTSLGATDYTADITLYAKWTEQPPTTVYLKPNSNWKQASARFAIYCWNSAGNIWYDMTKIDCDGSYYVVKIPRAYSNFKFVRLNPATTENNWNNGTKWNETGDLTVPTDNNVLFTVPDNAWDGSTSTWSTITHPTYTITLDRQGGTTGSETVTATYGSAAPSITIPTLDYYAFEGYYTQQNGQGDLYIDKNGAWQNIEYIVDGKWMKPACNLTLYAHWTSTEDKFNVTAVANPSAGGTVTPSEATSMGQYSGGNITAVAKDGYTFSGWTIISGSGYFGVSGENTTSNVANTTFRPTEASTVQANFTANTYTITFEKQEGTEGTDQVTVQYKNNNYSVNPVVTPTREGYTFGGYYVATGGSGFQVVDNQGNWIKSAHGYTDANGNWNKTANTTLYAKWAANTNTPYTVKHYKQNLDESYPQEATETENLTGTTDTKVTPDVKSYTGFTAPATQNVTIAADGSLVVTYQYTRNSYQLTWELAGGTITKEGTAAGNVKYETPLTAPTVEKEGYTFTSWSPEVASTMPAVTTTYTATWTANTYTVTFDANGGTGTMVDQSFTYDAEQTLSANTFTNGSLVFLGWATSAEGAVEYTDKQSVSNLAANNGETVTLYAIWATPKTIYLKTVEGTDDGVKWYVRYNSTETLMNPLGCTNEFYTAEVPEQTEFQLIAKDQNGDVIAKETRDGLVIPNDDKNLFNLVSLSAGGNKIFFKPNQQWIDKAAKEKWHFAGSFWTDSAVWKEMTDDNSDGIYECEKPANAIQVIFCLVNTTNNIENWGNNWSHREIQTDGDNAYKKIPNGSNLFTITDNKENQAIGTWSTHADTPVNGDGEWTTFTGITYRITFNQQGATTAGTTHVDVAYRASMPEIEKLPAKNEKKFGGYYTQEDGQGVMLVNAFGEWQDANGYISSTTWESEDCITLYAYWKNLEPEITDITLNTDIFEPVEDENEKVFVTAEPTIETHNNNGQFVVCWKLLYTNGREVEGEQYKATPIEGNKVQFSIAGLATGTYTIRASLHTGNDCGSGEEISRFDKQFSIVANRTITVNYTCDGNTIMASIKQNAHVINPTSITAPDIIGYTFKEWVAGDGVVISSTNDNSVTFTAYYDGNLTATYTKNQNIIYFYNTLGWQNVYVYFYDGFKINDNEVGYWNDEKGTGSHPKTNDNDWYGGSYKGYAQMTQITGTNIWYVNASGKSTTYLVFGKDEQPNYEFFYSTEVVRRNDYNKALPMYVPIKAAPEYKNYNGANKTTYYNKGYWMNYPENTGYKLQIYDGTGNGAKEVASVRFPYSTNTIMPLTVSVDLEAGKTYGFKILREDNTYFSNSGTMTANSNGWSFTYGVSQNCGLKTTLAGDYTFTLKYTTPDKNDPNKYEYCVDVVYPVSVGDYRVVYTDNANWSQTTAHDAKWYHPSYAIKKNSSATEEKTDIVSFFIAKNNSPAMKFQKCTKISGQTVTWADVENGAIQTPNDETEASVYNFVIKQPAGGESISVESVEPYTGNYYIRVDAMDGKWGNYKTDPDNRMTYSAFSENRSKNKFGELFSHYATKWCEEGTNVKFTIANDYSPCISDTLIQDNGNPFNNIDIDGNLTSNWGKNAANIRFMWNRQTNKISRAYVAGATFTARQFLILKANKEIKNSSGGSLSNAGDNHGAHQAIFSDTQNWIYERTIQVQPGTRVKLYACYPEANVANAQYFRGTYDNNNATWNDNNSVQILGGTGESWNTIRIIYDFKTNRLMAAWVPTGEITGEKSLEADMMILREHQEDAACITFANNNNKLVNIKTVYGVLRLNKYILNNKKTTGNHEILDPKDQKSIYERALYFISFPFDVHLSDVFGFGTYGTHWVISTYNGERRAKNGYFVDNCMNEDCTNWDYIWDPSNFTMKANQGYLLSLDLDLMKDNNESFWAHGINTVELYFPSYEHVQTIQQTSYTMPALGTDYKCKHKGHEVIDSYWRCIGVPSFADYNSELTDGTNEITWQPKGSEFPFLYEWNVSDNSLMVQATSTYRFRPTYAYLVQNGNQIHWSAVNATPNQPSNIVARRQAADEVKNYEWKLTLSRNEQIEDQAFVRLSDDEQVTTEFDFNQDLSKEFNYGRSDIYTLIGYEKAAANSLPLSEQTTLIPLGLSIEYNGDYTIAMPGRMENIGVTLIDTESNTRTNLSAGMEYTLTLNKGDYNNRFFIEISPIQQTPTDIEYVTGDSNNQNSVRKVLIDNILYIVRDGQIFDARGARVK